MTKVVCDICGKEIGPEFERKDLTYQVEAMWEFPSRVQMTMTGEIIDENLDDKKYKSIDNRYISPDFELRKFELCGECGIKFQEKLKKAFDDIRSERDS